MGNIFLQPKTLVAYAFIEEFMKTGFLIKHVDYEIYYRIYDSSHILHKDCYDDKLVFSENYLFSLDKLIELARDPFMPKAIADKVQKLLYYKRTINMSEKELKNYAKVMAFGEMPSKEKFGRFNGEDMTLLEFFNMIEELKLEVKSWMGAETNFSMNMQ